MSIHIPARKVTLFIGSPRKNSNTHLLAQEAERGLREQGVVTETLFLNDLQIRDCSACHGCKTEHNEACVISDDMQMIYRLIQESSGFIVAAPVYFGSVPAMTRAWLDRLVPFIGTDLKPKLSREKKISFIFAQNMPDALLFEPSLKSFMNGVAMTGLTVQDYLIAPDLEMGMKPPVTERSELLERAYHLGRDLAE
jgi:multimeric flavodoxin WrbA